MQQGWFFFKTAQKISSLLYNSHCIWQVSTFLSFEGSPPESGEYAICPVISSYVQYTEHLGCCDGFRIHPHLPAWCVCDTDGRACLTNIKCVQITNFKLRIIWLPIPSLLQDHRFLQSQECINGGLYLWGTPHSPIASIRALIALVLPAPVGPNIIIPWRTRCVSNNWRRRNCNNKNTWVRYFLGPNSLICSQMMKDPKAILCGPSDWTAMNPTAP